MLTNWGNYVLGAYFSRLTYVYVVRSLMTLSGIYDSSYRLQCEPCVKYRQFRSSINSTIEDVSDYHHPFDRVSRGLNKVRVEGTSSCRHSRRTMKTWSVVYTNLVRLIMWLFISFYIWYSHRCFLCVLKFNFFFFSVLLSGMVSS